VPLKLGDGMVSQTLTNSLYFNVTRAYDAHFDMSVTMTRSPGDSPLTISICGPDIRP